MNQKQSKVIWYCHPYAGSPSLGMSYRPYYLARAFQSAGHQAYVISPDFHHLLRQDIKKKENISLQKVDGLPYIFLKSVSYQGNGMARLLNMMSYVWRLKTCMKQLLAITGKPDIIIVSSSHPLHYPSLQASARRLNAKLIFEVRDLWPLSIERLLNVSPYHPFCLYLSYIERRAYRHADYVVSVLDQALPYMKAKGLSEERFKVIPNGISSDALKQRAPLPEDIKQKIAEKKQAGQFLVGYAGAMGAPNALKYLIEAMEQIEQQALPIHCFLIGKGELKQDLEAQVNQRGMHSVSFLPAVNKFEVMSFFEEMDILYLGWNDLDVYQYGVSPNKLYDYLLSGKPILESGGARKSLVESLGCGIRCKAQDSKAIAAGIKKLSELSEDGRRMLTADTAKIALEKFSYETLAEEYMSIF